MITQIGSITVSDRSFQGIYEDLSGQAIKMWLKNVLQIPYQLHSKVIPDEQNMIEKELVYFADQLGCSLILTTGGTGPAPRDVTPDATIEIADKVLHGFGERMRSISLKYVPTAILSRQVGVIRGKSLIVNLPGQPKSIQETLDVLFEAIPYCIELIGGAFLKTDPEKVKAFRPKSAPPLD